MGACSHLKIQERTLVRVFEQLVEDDLFAATWRLSFAKFTNILSLQYFTMYVT